MRHKSHPSREPPVWKRVLRSRWSYRLVRWSVALVFVHSGVLKLADITGFARTISQYGLVSESLVSTVAGALALVELAAGAGLVFDARGSLAVITGLLVLFSGVLGYGIWLGLEIDCGCFALGRSEATGGGLPGALAWDLTLILVCGLLYTYRSATSSRPREWYRTAWLHHCRRG